MHAVNADACINKRLDVLFSAALLHYELSRALCVLAQDCTDIDSVLMYPLGPVC
jgi:hypothetical protein